MRQRHCTTASANPRCLCLHMRRHNSTLRHCLLLALVISPGAMAANVGGAVALTSQLIDRGISIAPNKATLQAAGYWLPSPGWSVSTSVALQSPSLSKPVAVTAQAARAWMLDDRWQMQASLLYYGYPTNQATRTFDRQEASLAWSYRDVLTFSVSVFNFPRADQSPWNVAIDVTANVPLQNDFSLLVGAGSSRFPAMAYGAAESGRYQYGQLGLKWSRARWTLKLERIVTSSNTPRLQGGPGETPWLGTVSTTF
ncbi:TorF family putative porin [Xanthomonas hortorum]|uniref:Transporter n=1 Tax=Xanthomonas hortorum pv. gardneri TaxID=2754056 RepID=A0A6V7CW98_9XANT|nr:hypothetical protein CFBP2044_16340 [Xanthomonas hortorum pv. cynarae]CAD0323104.1 hypothetical protein CFBP8129_17340 [Xanthomonas hortorum pv. gardneri]CAD0339067.1 hypothetical protein NCPPB940_26660 [Xanthomonas hortorum pv. taraxaci]CAD0321400.1 hypothetical protein CFBP2044_16340 [Xanthomonas hortorum pv. cynarae]CAD0323114.1 hypothetical protein CFBP8129_17340 [Xanthomonas hortorum pv. gardneri]